MQVSRRTLYLGVFLISFGAVWLLARGQAADAWLTQALGLWPLVVIALGVGLLLRRTRLALLGGIVAAAVPGLLLGGVVVAAPDISMGCGGDGPATYATQTGSFAGAAAVQLRLACGEASVTTAPGSDWEVRVGDGGTVPTVEATDGRLTVRSAIPTHRFGVPLGSDRWLVSLPTAVPIDLVTEVDAGRADLVLAGAHLGRAEFQVNAGALTVDLGGASVDKLTLVVNAGAATLRLPDGSAFSADVRVAAGKVTICVPAGLGLRVSRSGDLGSFDAGPLVRRGAAWESADYATSAHRAEMNITVNVGSVDIVSEGACS